MPPRDTVKGPKDTMQDILTGIQASLSASHLR